MLRRALLTLKQPMSRPRGSSSDLRSRWRTSREPRYRLGGAGAVTTAEDYFRFAQMLNKGQLKVRILSRETVEDVMSDHIAGLKGRLIPRPHAAAEPLEFKPAL